MSFDDLPQTTRHPTLLPDPPSKSEYGLQRTCGGYPLTASVRYLPLTPDIHFTCHIELHKTVTRPNAHHKEMRAGLCFPSQ